ncbi:hypothetical protein K457DRAFT_1385394 [Linnemannia elongata AG-77]|uniref:Uncharacterized protein n=1 Tax=Linnemannia elongata AG-77 TaxID=1314771 RepID=A0A197JUS4_9FUNG|nr:hypothetical protein K457DRAFT_1385394 [Linnemannia elongata AG-77]
MVKQHSFPQSSKSFTTSSFYSCTLSFYRFTHMTLSSLHFFLSKVSSQFLPLLSLSFSFSLFFSLLSSFCLLFLFCLPSFVRFSVPSFFFFLFLCCLLFFLCHRLSQPIVLLPPSSLMNPPCSAPLFCSPLFFPLPHVSLYCPPSRHPSSRFLSHSYSCKKLPST